MRSPGPTRLRWPARLLQAAIIAGVSTLVGLGHTSLRFAMDTVDGAIPFGIGWLVNSLGWGVLIAGFVAVAELFSTKLDDNLTIPVAAAMGATLAVQLLGI